LPKTTPFPEEKIEPPDIDTLNQSNQIRFVSHKPPRRQEVKNALETLRGMPPGARQRWINSRLYQNFSPEERELLKQVSDREPVEENTSRLVQ
jgi:hypothetical protein